MSEMAASAIASQITHEQALAMIEPFYNLWRYDKRDWEKGFACLTDDWRSYDSNDVYRNKEETRTFLEHFFTLLPDIYVTNKQIMVDGDWIAVRSEIIATPSGEFFRVPHSGRRFHIMAVDLWQHNREGKLRVLYHSEHWVGAIAQLSGEIP